MPGTLFPYFSYEVFEVLMRPERYLVNFNENSGQKGVAQSVGAILAMNAVQDSERWELLVHQQLEWEC